MFLGAWQPEVISRFPPQIQEELEGPLRGPPHQLHQGPVEHPQAAHQVCGTVGEDPAGVGGPSVSVGRPSLSTCHGGPVSRVPVDLGLPTHLGVFGGSQGWPRSWTGVLAFDTCGVCTWCLAPCLDLSPHTVRPPSGSVNFQRDSQISGKLLSLLVWSVTETGHRFKSAKVKGTQG